jgi:intraflagellar transport protein 88
MYRMALDQIPNTSKEVRYHIKKNIGLAQIKMGHYQDAAATFEDIMEGNPDFQSGFNLIICYYAIGEHEKIRKGFMNLIGIPMEGSHVAGSDGIISPIEDDRHEITKNELEHEGKDNGSESSKGKNTNNHVMMHSLMKKDGLRTEIRARQKKAKEYILTAAKLCAPALDKKDWLAGYNWVIDAMKINHEPIASEMYE